MADNPLEIPQALRDMSEQNLKQVRAAYEQFTDFVTKTRAPGWARCPQIPWPLSSRMCKTAPCKSRRKMQSQFSRSRQDQQPTDPPRYCDASDAVRSRPDEVLHHADAGASTADRRCPPKLIFSSIRVAHLIAKKEAATRCAAFKMRVGNIGKTTVSLTSSMQFIEYSKS